MLLEWYQGERSSRQRRARDAFQKAKMCREESLVLYAMRLEGLANQAFADLKEREMILFEKFRNTTSAEMRQLIENQKATSLCMLGQRKLEWAWVKRLADSLDRSSRQRMGGEPTESGPLDIYYAQPGVQKNPLWTNAVPPKTAEEARNHEQLGYRPKTMSNTRSPVRGDPRSNPFGRSPPRGQIPWDQRAQFRCNNCGKQGHTGSRCYLAKGCDHCGSRAHVARDCTSTEMVNQLADDQNCPHCRSTKHLGLHCPDYRPTCTRCGGPHYGLTCTLPKKIVAEGLPLNR